MITQFPLDQLAIGVARQRRGSHNEAFRNHVVGEISGAEGGQLIGIESLLAGDDEGMNALAEHRAGLGDDRGFDDGRMSQKDVLHLDTVNLVAAAIDDVLLAIEKAQIAVVIYRADVAGFP
ncbi:MAG TPA: hypothetical protein VMO81_12305 [Aestuariivirgaceae bacterium]|nr:hypothetical protein [Aestuariivirgaceae bacterium]